MTKKQLWFWFPLCVTLIVLMLMIVFDQRQFFWALGQLNTQQQLLYGLLLFIGLGWYKHCFVHPSFPKEKKYAGFVSQEQLLKLFKKQLRLQWFFLTDALPQSFRYYKFDLLIGFPGSGKKTLVQAIEGFEPIPLPETFHQLPFNLEFWYSQQKIVCLVAPRLRTQIEPEHSSTFFALLYQFLHRKFLRYPIDAIHILQPITDLRSSKQLEQSDQMTQVNKILESFRTKNGPAVPINFIVGHADRIAGFAPFFETLDDHARQQAWSIQLEPSSSLKLNHFELRFNAFIHSLNQVLIKRMHHESQHHRLCLIKDFPIQLERLKASIFLAVSQLSLPNTFQLGEIKFVSACQDGRYIDFLKASLMQEKTTNIRYHSSPFVLDQSYFCQSSFQTLWASKAHLPKVNLGWQFRPKWLLMTLGFVFTALILIFSRYSMWLNQLSQIESHPPKNQAFTLVEHNAPLWARYQRLLTVEQWLLKNPEPKIMGYTLLPWQPPLVTELNHTRQKLRQQELIASVNQFFNVQFLTASSAIKMHQLYTQYQSIKNEPYPKMHFQTWLKAKWQRYLPSKQLHTRMALLPTLMQQLTWTNLTSSAQQLAQKQLTTLSWEDELDLLLSQTFPDTSIALNAKGVVTNSAEKSQYSLYSFDHVKAIIEQTIPQLCNKIRDERAHLGHKVIKSNLVDHCINRGQRNYLQHYLNAWQQTAQNLSVVWPDQLPQQLTRVQQGAQQQLRLQQSSATVIKALSAIQPYHALLNHDSQQQLKSLRHRNQIPNGQVLISTLKQLSRDLTTIVQDSYGKQAFEYSTQIMTQPNQKNALIKLNELIEEMPDNLQQALQPIVKKTWQQILAKAARHIDQVWQLTVAKYFNERLADKFPFTETALQDVDIADFVRFFRPKSGILSLFEHHYLAPFFVTPKQQAQNFKEHFSCTLPLNKQVIQFISQTQKISTAFFDQQQLISSFSIVPYGKLSHDITGLELIMYGESHPIDQQHPKAMMFSWPVSGDQTSGFIVKNSAGQTTMTSRHGPWSWFRLLNTAYYAPKQPDDKQPLVFPVHNMRLKFLIIPAKSTNPFKPHMLAGYMLPQHLNNQP